MAVVNPGDVDVNVSDLTSVASLLPISQRRNGMHSYINGMV